MKQTVILKQGGHVLYEGTPLNMPFKEDAVRKKSLELFDDDDPCIIHQSHIAREFVKTLQSVIERHEDNELMLKDYKDALYFIDAPEDAILILKG